MYHQQHPLSNLNNFDPNFMKPGHIVKYHDVFFKFDNGPILHHAFKSYCTLFIKICHIWLCLWEYANFATVGASMSHKC